MALHPRPIFDSFAETFDAFSPKGAVVDQARADKVVNFWQHICRYGNPMSGATYISGWLTAFTAFDTDGRWCIASFRGPYMIDIDKIQAWWAEVSLEIVDDGV